MSIKVSILSLGCARNLVDSEVMLGILQKAGCKIVDIYDGADIAIVNTCAFIEDAKKESIDAIFDLLEFKKEKKIKKLLVAGCLPQRYSSRLQKQIRGIDGFIGVDGFSRLTEIIKALKDGERVTKVIARPKFLYDDKTDRLLLTPRHYAYIKISEGCCHRCSFCVIPELRGPHRSRQINSVVKEAQKLVRNGAKEINLIGQDTTLYGFDIYGRPVLAELLKKLAKVKDLKWLRLLYAHPSHFSDDLIKVISYEPAICKYIDLPIQHINDRILQQMRRGTSKATILKLLEKIRKDIPEVAIRTAVIVGFPGETKAEFNELLDFIRDQKFERLGAFIYSREEDTAAHSIRGQIPENEKKSRWEEVMKLQQEISRENNAKLMGKVLEVLIDEQDESDRELFLGRTFMDAPEVDGLVYIKGDNLKVGDLVKAEIEDTYEYDLVGRRIITS